MFILASTRGACRFMDKSPVSTQSLDTSVILHPPCLECMQRCASAFYLGTKLSTTQSKISYCILHGHLMLTPRYRTNLRNTIFHLFASSRDVLLSGTPDMEKPYYFDEISHKACLYIRCGGLNKDVHAFSILYGAYCNSHLHSGEALERILSLHAFIEHMYEHVSLFPEVVDGRSIRFLFPSQLPTYAKLCDVILNTVL